MLLTFVVETVYSVDARTLVIASKNEEVFRVLDLMIWETRSVW